MHIDGRRVLSCLTLAARCPDRASSGGSTTAVSVLPAVLLAARARLFGAALAAGGPNWRGPRPEDLRLEDGAVIGHGQHSTVAQILAHQGVADMVGEAAARPDDALKDYSRQAFGAQFAEVHVDEDLGSIRVAGWVGAFDCGRVLNARTARRHRQCDLSRHRPARARSADPGGGCAGVKHARAPG